MALPNIVILGDYENALRRFGDWDTLNQKANLTFHHKPLQDEDLYEAVKDADAIAMVRDRSPLDSKIITRLPKLKFIMFTGERNGTLDTNALIARNIPIGCTPGGPSKETTAELTWALILGASKRLVEQNKLTASGYWRDQHSILPMLSGDRLGVIGLGSIGSRVAKVGAAFGMEVVAWSPRMTPERAAAENVKSVSLEELLETSKIVTMHLVVGPSTRGLISSKQLALMRPDSILVNTSRSALINMADLEKALKLGRPGQAAIDVFDIEPLPESDPLRNTPNLLVTPHLGFIAEPIFSSFSKGIIESLMAWLENRPIPLPFKPK
jgi:phosphoglycerate dehydrogenase-like enzyme